MCLACRRQWQQQAHAHRPQLRFNSGGADTWFDTLNDINDSYTTYKKPGADARDERKTVDEDAKPHSAPTPAPANLADLVERLISRTQSPKTSAQNIARYIAPTPPHTSTLHHHSRNLQPSLQHDQALPTSQEAKGTRQKQGVDTTQARSDFTKAFLSGQSRFKTDINPSSGTTSIIHEAYERHPDGSIQPGRQYLDLVHRLRENARAASKQKDEDSKTKNTKNERDYTVLDTGTNFSGARPFPTFQLKDGGYRSLTPVDSIHVPPGVTSTAAATTDAPKVWKAKTSPAASGLGLSDSETRINDLSEIGTPVPMSNRDKWGGSSRSIFPARARASFESLAQADQVSAKRPVFSTVNSSPFGLFCSHSHQTVKAKNDGISPRDPVVQTSPVQAEILNEELEVQTKADEPMIPAESDKDDIRTMGRVYLGSPKEPMKNRRKDRRQMMANVESAKKVLGRFRGGRLSTKKLASQRFLTQEGRNLITLLDCSSNLNILHKTQAWIAKRVRLRVVSKAAKEVLGSKYDEIRNKIMPVLDALKLSCKEEVRSKKTLEMVSAKAAGLEPAGLSIADAMKVGARAGGHGNDDDGSSKPPGPSNSESSAEQATEDAEQNKEQPESWHKAVLLSDIEVKSVEVPQPPVPYLEYGLDRVLFNPGVYHLQDPASRVYNFDPYLQKIMPVTEFDFNALKKYKTSSEDVALVDLAREQGKKFIGSTSSMTSSLAHFHYLISNWRPINLDMLSKGYVGPSTSSIYTKINRAPSAIFLRWKNGAYAIDADKEFDSGNVLMLLGKSMELFLTSPRDEYEKYRKSDPRTVSEEQRTTPESYHYATMDDLLMRSQLDAYDPRLPDCGTFDLKTRAVVSVRMQSHDPEEMTGYEIFANQGRWASYEKEYHDMMRATMLKYMLQARMGRMNGIFVAYHNVKRIFGFQYIPMHEMDRALHGQSDTCLGDQEFKASLKIFNDLLVRATNKFPEQSLRIHFETQSANSKGTSDPETPTALHMWAEPMTEQQIDEIQSKPKERIAEFERNVMATGETDITPTNSTDEAVSEDIEAMSEQTPELGTFVEPNEDDSSVAASNERHLGSREARADAPSIEQLSSTGEDGLKPLFFATTIIQSEVNGNVPKHGRPTNLKKSDKWKLEYLIEERLTNRGNWAMYEDMKARRKHALYSEHEVEDDVDEGQNVGRTEDKYIQFLKKLSAESSRVREMMNERDAGKEIVRVDQPLPKYREKIKTLEDYVRWMYEKEMQD